MLYEHIFLKNEGWDRISNRKGNVKRNQTRINLPPISNSGQINPKRGGGVPHSHHKSFLLGKRKMLLNWVLKKVISMARELGKGDIDASLSSGKKEGT